jgi:DNA-binding NtrC family response regulator
MRESPDYYDCPIVVLTNFPESGHQLPLLRSGADGFLDKEEDCSKNSVSLVEAVLERSLRVGQLRKDYFKAEYGIVKQSSQPRREDSVDLFGVSPPMRELFQQISRTVADHSAPTVLVLGATGTGKSTIARAIWALGDRSDKPFKELVINTIAPQLALIRQKPERAWRHSAGNDGESSRTTHLS